MKKKMLKDYIRNIPDFPKPGIQFKDITTLLNNKYAFRQAINKLAQGFKNKEIDIVVAAEARGFIFGGAVAHKLNAAFVPVRKKNKLPSETCSVTYSLEYGTDTLEMHKDAFRPGARILIIDDLLATGGTVKAIADLVKQRKGKIIGICFLIELVFLDGRKKLKGYPICSLIKY